ncbi:MAG: hypothetical protein A3B99_02245 [Candidatus Yanofskybacteria bacterium RIFCSPHIGHO2_02_FULL_44_12b]|uniref:Uncharacterized protein n=1 Tax=Candidatus Yanofskybacteria bacterium RIFCSPLOWO2_01_FULL_44_22 TaxID=1802697 RepID=A0A1F8GNL9_9BACT|nr:MAG: hypothetical protein A2659_04320 [Candidatus Yanofskybacteria bacterium RIFCSPHIGHO2_01_FULL_44_24]OGN15278.1 MAG: hypothetical protein A3B99_02245 [Candidatus Yanofskybacteria bacterium RIFCSPHIGHO2_02_FULL_44_12b]OGN26941.1 MAG: hypothetical protein A2925_01580 [Candidatus Yanofskybacteria bacterium RIFCSPLOWO2_01_FULL_44_22]
MSVPKTELANEPRGAWKNLLDSGIFGGNTFVSRLRRDPISASKCDLDFWRPSLTRLASQTQLLAKPSLTRRSHASFATLSLKLQSASMASAD